MIINRFFGGISNKTLPGFTYTGTYSVVDDGDAGWRIKFLSSGTLVLQQKRDIDVFCVGGGSSGNYGTLIGAESYSGGAGGAGGYTKTKKNVEALAGKSYSIVVGAGGTRVGLGSTAVLGHDGGSSSAFGVTAAGGQAVKEKNGSLTYLRAGNGGSGGGGAGGDIHKGSTGGTDGGNGYYFDYGTETMKIIPSSYTWGKGQGGTTREFGEPGGTLYAGGGGGGGARVGSTNYAPGSGGSGGGGKGATTSASGVNGTANTGGGGGGGCLAESSTYRQLGGAGGSGIVVIRNHRS